jgi:very-short-patch-repair endonuclease
MRSATEPLATRRLHASPSLVAALLSADDAAPLRWARPAALVPASRPAPCRARDAVAAGLLTRRQLDSSAWRRLFQGIYIRADVEPDHLMWCHAAALLLPVGGALSHRSAAHLYGADVLPLAAPVDVTVPSQYRPRPRPGLRVFRTRLTDSDVCRRGGLVVTRALPTAWDLARGPDLVEAVVGVDALLYRRLVTRDGLLSHLRARDGWPGSLRARRALELAVPGAESPMETRLRLLLAMGGLPPPVVQFDVWDRTGRFVARLDLAYARCRVGVEYDGDHHRERAIFQRDVARLNALSLCGWTVLRFTSDDVLRHPDRVVAQVRMALADLNRS